MKRVPFKIETNEGGSYAIIENPTSEIYGNQAYNGDKVVRSPFNNKEEALQRMEEIGKHWEYEPFEID